VFETNKQKKGRRRESYSTSKSTLIGEDDRLELSVSAKQKTKKVLFSSNRRTLMYWPTGSASRLSSTTSHPEEELAGIEACPPTPQAPIGLFATWTATELSVWNPKPKIVITKLVRSQDSLSRLGKNRFVKWKPDKAEHLLVISTVKSALIIYRLEALPDSSVYTLPPDHSTSFLSTGPADRIPFPTLALKLVGEIPRVDSTEEISCLALTPTHILIGISSPAPQ